MDLGMETSSGSGNDQSDPMASLLPLLMMTQTGQGGANQGSGQAPKAPADDALLTTMLAMSVKKRKKEKPNSYVGTVVCFTVVLFAAAAIIMLLLKIATRGKDLILLNRSRSNSEAHAEFL